MIPAAGDVAGCSWTSSDGELHNGKLDDIEPRRRYGDDPGGRRRGGLLTARGDHLLHGDHEMPMTCRTPPCMRAERKHAKKQEQNK